MKRIILPLVLMIATTVVRSRITADAVISGGTLRTSGEFAGTLLSLNSASSSNSMSFSEMGTGGSNARIGFTLEEGYGSLMIKEFKNGFCRPGYSKRR